GGWDGGVGEDMCVARFGPGMGARLTPSEAWGRHHVEATAIGSTARGRGLPSRTGRASAGTAGGPRGGRRSGGGRGGARASRLGAVRRAAGAQSPAGDGAGSGLWVSRRAWHAGRADQVVPRPA